MSVVASRATQRDAAAAIARPAVSALKRWWIAYMRWRIERWAIARLQEMSDRQLKDIGIVRANIEFAVRSGVGDRRDRGAGRAP